MICQSQNPKKLLDHDEKVGWDRKPGPCEKPRTDLNEAGSRRSQCFFGFMSIILLIACQINKTFTRD